MPNWNPLTNAVGGSGATTAQTYYTANPSNYGEYEYIYVSEAVDNFMAAYVGENKILANVLRGDVNFHAHRAVQELHYDTLRSCKAIEIEVCPSLIMPVPHDYINYVKLTWVDDNGIEHIIYPTRHTSNPFAIEQEDCEYVFNDDGTLTHEQTCTPGVSTNCDGTTVNSWFIDYSTHNPHTSSLGSYPHTFFHAGVTKSFATIADHQAYLINLVDEFCSCASTNTDPVTGLNCGNFNSGYAGGTTPMGPGKSHGDSAPGWPNLCQRYDGGDYEDFFGNCCSGPGTGQGGGTPNEGGYTGTGGGTPGTGGSTTQCGTFPDLAFVSGQTCTLTSTTWTNYSTGSGGNSVTLDASTTTSLAVDSENYFQNVGQRYGIQPEHAQNNGSFFIDCAKGQIHFGSNFSGKTIILHYISDGVGDPDQVMVHKMAEEALYKWIAYGCAQARTDVDPNTIARLKKEKFAETRKAKIRLSNIKIEEISQIMRNRSKWIKH